MELIERRGVGRDRRRLRGHGRRRGVEAHPAGLRVLVLEAGTPVTRRRDHGSFASNAARQLYRHLVSHRQDVQKSHPT